MYSDKDLAVFQVVGYKNSGKTTVTAALISYLTGQGLKVGTMKHHGHGGNPDAPSGTDSERHRKAGAFITGVEGESEFQLVFDTNADRSWEQIMTLYRIVPHDVLILEGYKHAHYPKIVLIRNEDDLPLLEELEHVCAIGVRDEWFIRESDNAFIFSLNKLDDVMPELAAVMVPGIDQ